MRNLDSRIARLEHSGSGSRTCAFIEANIYDTPKKVELRKAEIIKENGKPSAFVMELPGDKNL